MVVRFVCVVRVPVCARVSRVSPGSPRCLSTSMIINNEPAHESCGHHRAVRVASETERIADAAAKMRSHTIDTPRNRLRTGSRTEVATTTAS